MNQSAGDARPAFASHEGEESVKENKVFQPSTMRCPSCSQTWLVAGARRGESYLCKRCGTPLLAGAPEPLPNLRSDEVGRKSRGGARGGV